MCGSDTVVYPNPNPCPPQPFIETKGVKVMDEFAIKDSGERKIFSTGMQRDSGTKTLRPDLIWMPGIIRLAEHYGKGALKYAERNWEKAGTQEELDRFTASAYRHFYQYMRGDRDEDHVSAVIFNLFGMEYVKAKLQDTSK